MTPEEFFVQLRGEVERSLEQWDQFSRAYIAGKSPDELLQFFRDNAATTGDLLSSVGLVPGEQAKLLNDVALLLDRSKLVNDFTRRASRPLLSDVKFLDIVQRYVVTPASISQDDRAYLADAVTRDDTLLSGAVLIVTSDPDIRAALQIPTHVTAEQFMLSLRKAIRDSGTFEQINVGAITPLVSPVIIAVVAVGIYVVLAVAVVVQSYVGAAAYVAAAAFAVTTIVAATSVTVVAAGLASPRLCASQPQSSELTGTNVINLSKVIVWTLISHNHVAKRYAILPGTSTADAGLLSVVGVLIGGQGNTVQAIKDQRGVFHKPGIYTLAAVSGKLSEVTITDAGNGTVHILGNIVQTHEEEHNRAGFTENGILIDGRICSYRFDQIAAVAPPGFNYQKSNGHSERMRCFYDRVQLQNLITGIAPIMRGLAE